MRTGKNVNLGRWLALLLSFAIFAAACGSDDDGDAADDGATEAATDDAAADEEADDADDDAMEDDAEADDATEDEAMEDEAADESFEVAYLSASAANTWLASSLVEMETVGAAEGVVITEFDAQFDPAAQTTQLQDVTASGQYDGVIVSAINGPGLIPDIEAALEAGLEVVVLNQVIGTDLTTSEPQVDGVAASVLAAPQVNGERYGQMAIAACEGIDPCRVVYLFGIKGVPLDDALRAGFDATIADVGSIEVVAEGEGQYLGPDGGINAIQDILIAQPEFDVVVGADQSIQGVEIVLADEGLLDSVKLIGLGGSEPALEAIAAGTWFGTVYGAPADEGRIAMEAMVAALKDGVVTGGVDPLIGLTDDGLVTADNVSSFTAQWAG